MSIASTQSLMATGIESALSLGQAAQKSVVAQQITATIASAVPAGYIPGAPPIPLIPSGASATSQNIASALSLGIAAQTNIVAAQIGGAIAVLVPVIPPAGLGLLVSDISSALSKGQGAEQSVIANEIASAIVRYYQMGGSV